VIRRPIAVLALALAGLAPESAADQIVPSERVRSRVVVRDAPDRRARDVGSLRPGEAARWLETTAVWYRVELPDATEGFVSVGWTQRILETVPPGPEVVRLPSVPEPELGWFERTGRDLGEFFGQPPPVEITLHDPHPARTYFRHPEPRLPVAGYAAAADSNGRVDLMLALDASTSTNEFSETDVDGDGELEDEWGGDDSIYQAQILAARSFVTNLSRLPGNGGGERIRVGVVAFGGAEELRQYEPDRNFEPTEASLLALAGRDAVLHVPLGADYHAIERLLLDLGAQRPSGMTNFAAGIGRAMQELGRLGPPRDDASEEPVQRVIDFLTDGLPSLPYARIEAERAARYAARMAEAQGVRINVFELGKNAVTRKTSATSQRMAQVTGGSLIAVDRPGNIVDILRATSLTFVERVRLVNRTIGVQTRYIATGIDGSFYGEVPLQDGRNDISVVAVLHDGRERETSIAIDYDQGLTEPELAAQLKDLQLRNQALIEDIRAQLAHEIATQKKKIDLDVDRDRSVGAGPLQ
jgi:hypothetical protein